MNQKYRAIELLAAGEKWTDKMTRAAFPILLWAATHDRTITYKQLAEELELVTKEPLKQRMTLYGKPAGKIGNALVLLADETGWDIPPLNAIVVNASTHLPGDGATYYIKKLLSAKHRKNLSSADQKALGEAAIESVLNYSDWPAVARELNIKTLSDVKVLKNNIADSEPIQFPPASLQVGGYPESQKHKALKLWAAENPKFFSKFGEFNRGENEKRLASGDSLDAYLENKKTCLAIEVKASNAPDAEVFRGIFQCVKYRATLRAMQKANSTVSNANAVLLLATNASSEAKRLAKRLQIEILKAPTGADHI